MSGLQVGDRVRIIAGRYRRVTGVLEDILDAPTPSGSTVRVARVKRPRGGLAVVFLHEIEKAEEAPDEQ